MKIFVQVIIFRLTQIIFLPATLTAALILNYKALVKSKKFDIDYTAEKVLQLRCRMHLPGVRKDEDSFALYQALPVASASSLRLLVAPALLANKLTGYKPSSMMFPDKNTASIRQYIYVRTVEFDRIMKKNIGDIRQVVVLGAGYDLRIFNHVRGKGMKVYELDRAPIQELKRNYLSKTGLEKDSVTYVPADFNKESWSNRLLKSGFDPNRKTFFFWEGVASYLDENLVINTLKILKSISGNGSIISFDYNSKLYNDGKGTLTEKIIVRLMKMSGKVFLFGIDTSDAKNSAELFLQKCDLKLKELTLIGQDKNSVHPFSGLIAAKT